MNFARSMGSGIAISKIFSPAIFALGEWRGFFSCGITRSARGVIKIVFTPQFLSAAGGLHSCPPTCPS